MNTKQIVQGQLDAYNAGNLDKFVSYFSNDIKVYKFQESTPYLTCMEKFKAVYKDVFDSSPELKAIIDTRIVFDNKVIDHEKVTGRKGAESSEVIAIYEIENKLITKVVFIKKQ
ncbi:nuclear transport factor 2 family protein [Aquimarina sp. I32.4]|uniref:nuclear transport factor 2 family protein n=1 Tax=Aquimarina sp. I32.4 TaxID=2053903 RepID=UPI000CDEDD23|nr:nuclear transport factor 2 family protein [Aquimarina sp. I32.4]